MSDAISRRPCGDQETAKAKIQAQRDGIKYGCHVDLDDDAEPDHCVKDIGSDADCIYAGRHKTREGCRYWLPVGSAAAAPPAAGTVSEQGEVG